MAFDRLAQAEGTELRQALTQALQRARAEFSAEIRLARGGTRATARYTDQVDDLIRQLSVAARARTDTAVAVLALGGYGRRHLCLYSDVDLLVIFDGQIGASDQRFLKALLHPLWDLRLEVGHQVRELAELQQVDADNPEFLAAVIDARLLDGDVALFQEFRTLCHSPGSRWREPMLSALLALVAQRHGQFNDTLYQLEPDVKDAPGALRDVTALRAIAALASPAAASLLPADRARLDEAEDFLLRIRSILHLECGRNVNLLSHSLQETVADLFGCPGLESHRRVEALMTAYFHHARIISRLLDVTMHAVRPAPAPIPAELLGDNIHRTAEGVGFVDTARASLQPHTWLQVFEAALEAGCPVSAEARSCIERHGERYSPEQFFPADTERDLWLRFLRPRAGLYDRLSEMHDCGLLGRMFPEFQKIYCRMIRDFHHKYTVDEHTLLTIRNLESLCEPAPSRERFAAILRELGQPEILVLSLLFHDVGKWTDVHHSEESVRMVQGLMTRLRVPADAHRSVEFLIQNHLQMSVAAFRRDTEDPDVVRQFATLVGTEDHLKMLCLMTLVDIEAVSPDTLTPWKEELLWRLYVDTYNELTLGYGDAVIDAAPAALAEVLKARPPEVSESELTTFLAGLPQRYLRLVDRSNVYEHVRLSRNINPEEVHSSLTQAGEVWELTVVTLDKPRLFSNICGVLSYFGMDILRGQAMTNRNGLVLDIFQFTDRDRFFRMNPTATPQFNQMLKDVVAGRVDVSTILRGKERGLLRRGPLRVQPVVHFDDHYSRRHTILEIVAQDAWGLLYRISRAISKHHCDIDLVLISTEGDRAIDVFHITQHRRKLPAAAQDLLRRELERVLTNAHEADQGHRPSEQG